MTSREKVAIVTCQNQSSSKWSTIDIRPFHCKCHIEKVLQTQTLKNDEYILSNIKNQKIWKKGFVKRQILKLLSAV